MKFFTALFALATVAVASPIVKRQQEAATVGFATLNGGTTGGAGGTTVSVGSLAEFEAAVTGDEPRIVLVTGAITGVKKVMVGSNKSILGSGGKITGVGMHILEKKNVIVRNLVISKVTAEAGDGIWVQTSTNIWIDHNEFFSDQNNGKDYYDGLVDVTRAADFVTISNNYFHDHYKGSLVGHSDNNADQDEGHLKVTYVGNYFKNINSRGPSFRFGTGHIYNNYYENVADGINTRQGAQLLVESNVFVTPKKPLYSTDAGYAVARNNDFGGKQNAALQGTLTDVDYDYSVIPTAQVVASVKSEAGATL